MSTHKPHEEQDEQRANDWIQSKWRPLMAVLYMAICACDFMLFPVGWTVIQALFHGVITSQWQPLTLQGGGLIHIAFGAILGISAWGRTQEKLAGVSANTAGLGTVYIPPGQGSATVINSNQPLATNNTGFGTGFGTGVNTGFGTGVNTGFNTTSVTTDIVSVTTAPVAAQSKPLGPPPPVFPEK
jgi:Holin of 3TMs, for gene-transfer release